MKKDKDKKENKEDNENNENLKRSEDFFNEEEQRYHELVEDT